MEVRESVKKQITRWFGNRMPTGEKVRLSQKSTYIWPTHAGYLLIGILILMMIGATNYQNNLAFLLTFLLVGIGLVTIIYTFKNIQGIEFSQLNHEEVFSGQPITLNVGLKSLNGDSHYSVGVGLSLKNLIMTDIPKIQLIKLQVRLESGERGWLSLPRLMITSQFPFGWLRTWAYLRFDKPVLIYPTPVEPPANKEKFGGEEQEGGDRVRGSEELYGLKNYQAGEPLTRVDWKSYARGRGLHTREFADFQNEQLCFSWYDYPSSTTESRLSFLTYVVLEAARNNLSYQLILPDQTIEFASDENQRLKCLRALSLFGKNKNNHD